MNKKAIATDALVWMILGLVALLVLLGVTKGFGNLITSITGKNECQIEFLISSFTKTGGLQNVAPQCEPHKITITLKNLSRKEKRIKGGFDAFSEKYGGKSTTANDYINYYNNANEPWKEWAMNEIIAKEMKYCWDITGQGKLDLFSDWWALIQCEDDKGNLKACTRQDVTGENGKWAITRAAGGYLLLGPVAGIAVLGAPIIWKTVTGDTEVAKPPTFCVLCSRIKFDQEVQRAFSNDIDSLGLWLASNPVSDIKAGTKIPYAAYLQNDAFEGIWANKHSYTYNTQEAHAVLYARVNVYQATEWYKDIIQILGSEAEPPESVQILKLVKYKDIQNECTVLVG